MQLLDLAAELRGLSTIQFETAMIQSGATDRGSLRDLVLDAGFAPVVVEAGLEEALRTGRVLLVLAAPEIPSSLARTLSYLNAHGLAIAGLELRRFPHESVDCIVPTFAVAPPATHPVRRTGRRWDEGSLVAALGSGQGERVAGTAAEILEWARRLGLTLRFGRNAGAGYVMVGIDDEASVFPVALWANGAVEILVGRMADVGARPFDSPPARRELQTRLSAIPGVDLDGEGEDGRPCFPLALLAEPDALEWFLDTLEWAFEEARAAATRVGPG